MPFSPNPSANPGGSRKVPIGIDNMKEGRLMVKFVLPRNCPRCRGSMIPERDWYGEYSTCLCCGYVHEAVSAPPIELLEEEENGHRQRRRQPSHGKIRL